MSGRRRLVAALLTGAVATALAGAALAGLPTRAEAAPTATTSAASILQSFNPADIISDAVMYNPSTMSVAQIQSFLNAQQPTCASGYTCLKTYRTDTQTMAANLMCGTYSGASNESAATIIYKVAHACKVNPQVILVTLQKEQGLITGVNLSWYPNAYRSATGLACPDTAPCDPSKYGFFNQVYGLGYWLIRYTTPPGTTGPGWTSFSWFPVGQKSAILYNPDPSCGSKLVTIANKATASLYYYTPYVPNAAALAAGYGVGDSCSAYGNRNFYLYFTQWFGSTHLTVTGAIETYWASHSSILGAPTANAVTSTSNGGGTYQTFQRGTVYSSKAGTFSISGALLSGYSARKGPAGPLGWPTKTAASRTVAGITGTVQSFQYGDLYTSTAGTGAVMGSLRSAYSATGGQLDALGWPTGDAATSTAGSGGTIQIFTGGRVYVPAGKPVVAVTGRILATYLARGEVTGTLGWPVSSSALVTAHGTAETVQTFSTGAVYQVGTTVTTVSGDLYTGYALAGGPAGRLGWVTGSAVQSSANGGGWTQSFSGGNLYDSSTTHKAFPVTGGLLNRYRARNEVAGDFGWPVSAPMWVTAHGVSKVVQSFQHGSYTVTGPSVVAVDGAIYPVYLAAGGPTGDLGWVKGWASRTSASGGGWSQAFTGGTIYYSSVSRNAFPVSGAVLTRYQARHESAGDFGWPVSAATTVTVDGATKVVQSFEHGMFTATGPSVVAVSGAFFPVYVAAGGPTGDLGWVKGWAARTSASGGGWSQAFTGGTIYYSSVSRKAFPVAGDLLAYYLSAHEAAGPLGWPTGAETTRTVTGGVVRSQSFQHGTLTSTNGVVTLG